MPVETPVRTPVRAPVVSPEPAPLRRLYPDEGCPSQKEETRRIVREPLR